MPLSNTLEQTKREVLTRFPGVRDSGGLVCRKQRGELANPNLWSQHAYGNAWDAGVSSLALGDQVYAFLKANKTRLGLGTILWRVASHYDHLHIEGANKAGRNGRDTPQCAGGSAGAPSETRVGAGTIPTYIEGGSSEGGGIGGFLDAVGNVVTAPVKAVELATDPKTWLRVLWFIGGAVAVGAGVTLFVKDVAGVDLAAVAKTAATKGLA